MPTQEIWNEILHAVDFPLFVVDTERTIIFANQSATAMVERLGFIRPNTEVVGRHLFAVMPKLPASLALRYDELFVTGQPQAEAWEFHRPEGSVWIRSRRFPLFTDGTVSRVVTVFHDETEVRAGREALRQSEATARAILDAASESILLADLEGTILTANETAARRLNRPLHELLGRKAAAMLPPGVWRDREPHFREVIKTGRMISIRDKRDDTLFDTTMYPVRDDSGTVRQVAVFAVDVTKRVDIENELIRIRQAVESSSDAIGLLDMNGRPIYSNPAFQRLLGYTADQLEAAGIPGAAYRDAAVAAEVFAELRAGKPWSGVISMITHDGRELQVYLQADAIRDAEGKLIGLIGIHTDVTAERIAAEQLRRSEERFRLLFKSIPVPTFIWEYEDGDFLLRGFNQAAETMTLGGIVNFVGQRASNQYRRRPDIVEHLTRCHETQTTIFREMSYAYQAVKDERFLSVYYVPIPPNLILVHTIDLTDRKRAEKQLQNAHLELEKRVDERTRSLQRQIEFDVLLSQLLTSFASSRATEIPKQILASLTDLAAFFDAEHAFIAQLSPDRNSYNLTYTKVPPGMRDFATEYRNAPLGTLPWIEQRILLGLPVAVSALRDLPRDAAQDRKRCESEGVKSALLVPLRGRGGQVTGTIGLRSYSRTIHWNEDHHRWLQTVGEAVANVLERKQAEDARQAEQEKAELYLQTAEVMLVALATDGSIIRINRKGCDILGYEAHELIGRMWFEVCIPPEEREAVRRAAMGYYDSGGTTFETFENSVLTRNGERRLIAWRNAQLFDDRGELQGMLSSGEDITERRRADLELARAYDQLRTEREALQQKNVALHELVQQVQESRKATAAQIQSNLDRLVLPILERVSTRLDPEGQEYLSVARSNLADILSPYVSDLENRFKRLSPREIEICELIRRGFDSKQIADLRNSSVQTVLKQRKMIRKKLGLDQKKVNLATYLSSGFPTQKKREKR